MNLAKIHTSCQSCKYAKYEDNTQIGCEFSVIENLQRSYPDMVIGAENDVSKFFVINDKICPLKRIGSYPAGYNPKDDLKFTYHYILKYKDDENTFRVIRRLKQEKYPPHQVTIVVPVGVPSPLEERKKDYFRELTGLRKWSFSIEEKERPWKYSVHDIALATDAPYYVTNEAGFWENSYFTTLIMQMMIYRPAFSYITLSNGYVVMSKFHKMIYGDVISRLEQLWPNKSMKL